MTNKRIKPLTPAAEEKALSDLKRAKAAEDIAKSFKRRALASSSVTISSSEETPIKNSNNKKRT